MEPQLIDNRSEQDILDEIKQLQSGIAFRQQSNAYKYFIPNGSAEKFIGMVGSNKYFINLFIAANGVSKTATLCNIIANICFEPNLDWFNYPLYTKFPYIPKGRIISDTTTVTKTIVPELRKWLPKDKYDALKADKHFESVWRTKSNKGKPNFEFDVMTYEQDVRQFESATLGFAIFDEPVPEAVWKATISRMRRGGIIICAFTPLMGSAYFYDSYVTAQDVVRF